METMAASSKKSVADDAEANSNEAMDTNSSGAGSRGEKCMDASFANSSLRESSENSVSSPGHESRSDGDDREQFTGEQTLEVATDGWEEKNDESGEAQARSRRNSSEEGFDGEVPETLRCSQAVMNPSHIRESDQEACYQGDSTTGEEIGDLGTRSRKSSFVESGETELNAPGALLHASFADRPGRSAGMISDNAAAVEASEAIGVSYLVPEHSTNPSFEQYGDISVNNDGAQLGGLPRIIHTDINPRLVAPVSSMGAASSTGSGSNHGKSKAVSALRRGKWTVEEEAYVARVIQDFNSGFLDAPAGTTLRSYLSDKLHCDPMRITKKFTGDACIGKRVFHPAVRCAANASVIDKAQAELNALERRWRRRLEMQQRESAKKAAASAAAFAAGRGPVTAVGIVPSLRTSGSSSSLQQQVQQSVVARTASWLDRANSILQGNEVLAASASAPELGVDSGFPLPKSEIMNQMEEVQRLIHEGPIIQQTTAGIAGILDQEFPQAVQSSSEDTGDPALRVEFKQAVEPADKRMRRTSMNSTGAEDAEALVGFLRSVRASAASEEFSG